MREEPSRLYREPVLDTVRELDQFLSGVQGRAFRMAQIATGSSQEALDVVQDAMFKLVEKYRDRPAGEWQPLFFRILQSRINDWYRRNQVRNRHQVQLDIARGDEGNPDPIQSVADPNARSSEETAQTDSGIAQLQQALQRLPLRQQQAFLLRAWEGLDVKQTALAMSCAEGSVKTHYSRAIHALREQLGDYSP